MKMLIVSQLITISGVKNGVILDKKKARSTQRILLAFSALKLNIL